MRIKNIADAVDGRVGHFGRVDLFHVLAVDFGKNLVQSGYFIVEVAWGSLLVGGGVRNAQGGQGRHKNGTDTCKFGFHAKKIQFLKKN